MGSCAKRGRGIQGSRCEALGVWLKLKNWENRARVKREEDEAAEACLQEEQELVSKLLKKLMINSKWLIDATRDLMRQYEEEFNDNYSAGASPSSDFGF